MSQTMNQNNPLRQYFRQPAIYLRLPSQGKFYPPGTLDMPANNELPVLPMTAVDEITYRTPDALFNGSAVVSVIQSCMPNIRDAWAIPAMDVDSVLIGIRMASYGHNMDFGSSCPSCGHEADHQIDLRTVLDRMQAPDYESTINQGDLTIYFRPMTYKNLNENNQMQFEEQKILQLLSDSEMPDDQKVGALSLAMQKITEITVKALGQSIAAIKTPDALVNDNAFIVDFLKNCDRTLFNRIRDHIIEIRTAAEMKPFELECSECHHKYMQSLTLDMSSFFGDAS